MTLYIALIVEGHSEADGAAERLLQRIWKEMLGEPFRLQVLSPSSRCKRDAFVNTSHPQFAEKVEEAALKLTHRVRRDPGGRGLLLLLLDAENECPVQLAPSLLEAAKAVRSDIDISCVLAKQMLENWIVAGASRLAGVNGLPDQLTIPDPVEEINGAGWLDKQVRTKNQGRKYKKTVDAKEFISKMALPDCRAKSPSFDKLCRELEARLPPPPPEPPAQLEQPSE